MGSNNHVRVNIIIVLSHTNIMIWEVGQFVLIWRRGGESLQILASL